MGPQQSAPYCKAECLSFLEACLWLDTFISWRSVPYLEDPSLGQWGRRTEPWGIEIPTGHWPPWALSSMHPLADPKFKLNILPPSLQFPHLQNDRAGSVASKILSMIVAVPRIQKAIWCSKPLANSPHPRRGSIILAGALTWPEDGACPACPVTAPHELDEKESEVLGGSHYGRGGTLPRLTSCSGASSSVMGGKTTWEKKQGYRTS